MSRRYCTIAKVMKEGRITIPVDIREFAKIKEGDILDISIEKLTREDEKPKWSKIRNTQVKVMKEGRITIPGDIREFEDIKEDNFLEISYEKLINEVNEPRCGVEQPKFKAPYILKSDVEDYLNNKLIYNK